jgi:hypothetical protein
MLRVWIATELYLVFGAAGTFFGVGLQLLLNLMLGPQPALSEEVRLAPFFVAGILQVPVATMAMVRKSRGLLLLSLLGPFAVVIACAIFQPALLGFGPASREWVERRSLLSLLAGSVLLVVYAFDRMAGKITFPGQSELVDRVRRPVDQNDQPEDQDERR